MTEKRMVRVTVYDEEKADDDGLPTDIADAIVWLVQMREEIPEEHRQSGKVEIESLDCYSYVRIYFERPETDEECAARLARSKLPDESQRNRLRALVSQYPDIAAQMLQQVRERSDEP